MVGGDAEPSSRAEESDAKQRAGEKPAVNTESSDTAPKGDMGLVHGEEPTDATPAPDTGKAGEVLPEEEIEVEEIICPTEEKVDPQRIFIA